MNTEDFIKGVRVGAIVTLIIVGVVMLISGCVSHSPRALPSHPIAQSWDQQRLKRDDVGCPTAIYAVDKNGNLYQCPPVY